MRVIALAASLAILSGCSDPAFEHTPDERAEFDARIANDLRAARERRAQEASDNRRFLNRLSVFPGARLVRETHQGNDESEPDELDEKELEYEIYLSEVMQPYAQYELITADRWSTYRAYRVPRAVTTDEVHAHYARLLRSWIASERDRGHHVAGHRIFTDDYWRDGRCVWVHIGLSDQPADTAAADVAGGDDEAVSRSLLTRVASVCKTTTSLNQALRRLGLFRLAA